MNEANKCKTAFDEMFCMSCKDAKKPLKRQIQLMPENKKFLRVKAICQSCKNQMFKSYKLDDLQKLKQKFDVVQLLQLYDCKNPPSKTPFFNQDEDSKKESKNKQLQFDLFT